MNGFLGWSHGLYLLRLHNTIHGEANGLGDNCSSLLRPLFWTCDDYIECEAHFVDGLRGDGDVTPNGIIVEPGGPGMLHYIEVSIDIKPGSDLNCFNNDGNGVIPVAILGSAEFDVNNIDPATIELEGLGVRAVGKSNKLLAHIEDINNDSFDDLVVQIEDDNRMFAIGDETATLTGKLYDGTSIKGTDSICIVP